MASPAVSTPSSVPSPANIAPALATTPSSTGAVPVKMLPLAPSAALPQAQAITTTKEWVIPPRPKPGRKPATDTPPTKRKAQNRAAQRAFRERRAARVGELEEQLEEARDEQARREKALHEKLAYLEGEIARLNGDLEAWRLRCDTLDRIAEYERKQRETAVQELSYLRYGSQTTSTDAVSLPPRKNRSSKAQTQQQQQPQHHHQSQPHPQPHQQQWQERAAELFPSPDRSLDSEDVVMACGNCKSDGQCVCLDTVISQAGCGKCSSTTRCQCIDDTIKIMSVESAAEPQRAPTPIEDTPLESMEIDFTASFSKGRFAASKVVHDPIVVPATTHQISDPCGFCEEGTYCMCAEAAAAAAVARSNNNGSSYGLSSSVNRLAPILNEVTPPPSDGDAAPSEGHVKLPSINQIQMRRAPAASSEGGCGGGGPGTCSQCQKDPMSGLFCRSLAALRESGGGSGTNSPAPGGCCGGGGAGGGCCRSQPSNTPAPAATTASPAPPSLSCADAYKTLSTHKNFEAASDELNMWLGKLQATPAQQEGRAPMEVEAASVMGVLKMFDRRFGRG